MNDDPTFLTTHAVNQRMRCSTKTASIISDEFVTAEQLVSAVESGEDLSERDGVGEKTVEAIEDWWEHREERERHANETTIEKKTKRSATVTFHGSWADAIGMEELEQ